MDAQELPTSSVCSTTTSANMSGAPSTPVLSTERAAVTSEEIPGLSLDATPPLYDNTPQTPSSLRQSYGFPLQTHFDSPTPKIKSGTGSSRSRLSQATERSLAQITSRKRRHGCNVVDVPVMYRDIKSTKFLQPTSNDSSDGRNTDLSNPIPFRKTRRCRQRRPFANPNFVGGFSFGPGYATYCKGWNSKTDMKVPSSSQSWAERYMPVASVNERLARILPYNSIQRLLEKPNQCIACTAKSTATRCKHPTRWKDSDTVELLSMLPGIRKRCSLAKATPLIQRLIHEALSGSAKHKTKAEADFKCLSLQMHLAKETSGIVGRQVQSQSNTIGFTARDLAAVPAWLAALTLSNSEGQELLALAADPEIFVLELRQQIDAKEHSLQDTSVGVGIISRSQPSTTRLRTDKTNINRNSRPPANSSAFGTALDQEFVSWPGPTKDRRLTDIEAVRQAFSKPMGMQEQSIPGYIYIYWTFGNFGYVKIGVTTRLSNERLDEWRRDCGHDARFHAHIGANGSHEITEMKLKIPHMYRVEKLVHTELRQHRLKEFGCRCGKMHKEWFSISPQHAEEVVLKWSRWMAKRHLAYNAFLRGSTYPPIPRASNSSNADGRTLGEGTAIMRDEINSICTPLENKMLSLKQVSESKATSILVRTSAANTTTTTLRMSPRNHPGSTNPIVVSRRSCDGARFWDKSVEADDDSKSVQVRMKRQCRLEHIPNVIGDLVTTVETSITARRGRHIVEVKSRQENTIKREATVTSTTSKEISVETTLHNTDPHRGEAIQHATDRDSNTSDAPSKISIKQDVHEQEPLIKEAPEMSRLEEWLLERLDLEL